MGDQGALTGKVVVITGASRGIGAAAARAFAAVGARVALLARDGAGLAALAAEIGDTALALPCDVAAWTQVDGAIAATMARWGRIDAVINNAAVIDPIGPLGTVDPAAWGRLININVTGAFHVIRATVPHLTAGGTVITISSGAAHHAMDGWSAYCASKAAAAMLTNSLHLEYGPQGIRALGLSPGTVATDMQRLIKASGVNPVSQLDWSAHIPPDWVARALVWMCGPDADDLVGTEVTLRDEGIRARIGLTAP
jgi:NAD(P)-dependent dehydrogenase (short-subunit alcohol dehydrogenase family)